MQLTGERSWIAGIPEKARRFTSSRLFLLADLTLLLALALFWLVADRTNSVLLFLILALLLLTYVEIYRRESRWVSELSDLNSDLSTALAESDTLAEIGKEFSAEIEVEVLFDLVARRARELLGADYASVAIVDEDTGETVWVAGAGLRTATFFSVRREPGEGLVGRAMATGQPVVVEGFGANPEFPPSEHPLHSSEGMVAALVMPMARGARSLGALTVGFRKEHSFVDHEKELLEALAGQAGIAMENATLFSEEKRRVAELEAVLDHMSEGVIVTNPSGRVLRSNEAAKSLLGNVWPGMSLSEPEWLRDVEILDAAGENISPDQWPLVQAARGERFVGREVAVRRGDARLRHLSVDGRPVLGRRGEVVLGVTVIHDVTAAREMDQLKDEFLSLAAHELKTPLTSIKGYAQMLLSAKADSLGEFKRKALQVMDQQADRINRMVEQFLLVEEIRSGRLSIRPEKVDLTEVVGEVCDRLGKLTSSHEVSCTCCNHLFVNADARSLDLVLSNLLENALKFSPEGSAVEVTVCAVGGDAQVCVKDYGVGIPKDKLGFLFHRFYQVQPGTQKGAGLGLYISQELIASHGGRMWVESAEGEGSCFFFALPLARDDSIAAHG